MEGVGSIRKEMVRTRISWNIFAAGFADQNDHREGAQRFFNVGAFYSRGFRAAMTSAICTLFEGDYHYGLGALVNSLYHHGYRGVIYAGYRGSLPPWIEKGKLENSHLEFPFAPGASIRLIEVSTPIHLTNHKPAFMMDLWEKWCPDTEALFYFDPDITIKCRWSFFEEWVEAGVTLCEDVNPRMPSNHPVRNAWRRHCEPHGIVFAKEVDSYVNGGFVGLKRTHKQFVCLWKNVIELIDAAGADLKSMGVSDRTQTFTIFDQDALNIAVMTCYEPVSIAGQDAMDLQYGGGGYIMSHALGNPKPWRKKMLWSALNAIPPSRADKAFLNYAKQPVQIYSPWRLRLKKADLLAGSALGRYIR
jgi:hypothetical protein